MIEDGYIELTKSNIFSIYATTVHDTLRHIAEGNKKTLKGIDNKILEIIFGDVLEFLEDPEDLLDSSIRKCPICEEYLIMGDYIKVNFKYNTNNIEELVSIWNNKIIKILCCCCNRIIEFAIKREAKNSNDIKYLIDIYSTDIILSHVKKLNLKKIIENLKLYKIIDE